MKKKSVFFFSIAILLYLPLLLAGCAASGAISDDLSTLSSETNAVIHSQPVLSTENGSSEAESETSSEPETATEAPDPLLEEASYYFPYYLGVYSTYNLESEVTFDARQFRPVYNSIRRETLDTYFSRIEWITREEGISLSLTPSPCLLPQNNASLYLWMARCIHAFELVSAACGTDARWEHPDSLKPQYHCHAIFARDGKTPWNIEPYRTETDFLKIMLAQGNPPAE